MTNFFKILESACNFSSRVANRLFGETTLLSDLCAFLPTDPKQASQGSIEEFKLVPEVVALLQALISDKENESPTKN